MAQYLDWFIFTKKTVVMQRLGDLARTGHIFYVAGQIPREKAGYLAGKLDGVSSRNGKNRTLRSEGAL